MRQYIRLLVATTSLAILLVGGIQFATVATAAPPGDFCGGIAGIPCPEGFVCVDVPGDGCNPNQGGADCAGYCKRSH
jgi:hypothetical protein